MRKDRFPAVLAILLLAIPFAGFGINKSRDAVKSAFLAIRSSPVVINYLNDKEINNSGGHLQGIQLVERKSGKFAVMTGSSDSYSYCAVVRLGDKSRVLAVNKLMDKPFKHAGGCQVFKNYLAAGIEDNAAKDKSMVCIYELSEPERPVKEPLAVIKRSGEPMRSTAGCVGITKYRETILMAVGDWDTKHIDLYSSPINLSVNSFNMVCTFETAKLSREGWSDPEWWPYQNINLLTVNDKEVYLVGMGQNNLNEDLADLFSLEEADPGNFKLVKIATKKFSCREGASFKAAAGIIVDKDGQFSVISSGYNTRESSFLNIFESPQQ